MSLAPWDADRPNSTRATRQAIPDQQAEDPWRWATHSGGVLRALRSGIYRGWDLHPAQLPSRFAATLAFCRDCWIDAASRLGDYHRQSGDGVMDEPATAYALARHLAAARACGAIDAAELDVVGGIGDDVLAHYLIRGAVPGVGTQ